MKTRAHFGFAVLVMIMIVYLVSPSQTASAGQTWVVTTLGDSAPWNPCTAGGCTLRSAINYANSGDTITFAPTVIGTIQLLTSYGGLVIDKNLTIEGPGAFYLTISGSGGGPNKNFSIFTVNPGGYLNLSRMSITFGWNLSGSAALIQHDGTLIVDQCNFYDNYSREDGAVFYNHGNVTISRSFFGENHAAQPSVPDGEGFGGAIENNGDGVMTITNSTFAHNGAIQGGAIDNMGILTIINSTIKDNSALETGGLLNEAGGIVTLKNVLLADNENGNCGGAIESGSTNNLSTDTTCSPGFTQVSPAALALGSLKGIPAYYPLNYGSVAIDAGTNDGCPAIDQEGKHRPIDGDGNGTAICDIGAYEAWAVNFLPIVRKY